MRKTLSLLCVAALAAILLGGAQAPRLAYSQGFGATWDSTFQVLNLNALQPASISISYYDQNGSLATMDVGYSNPQADTVLAGASNTYNPIRAAAGFNGSVVIASDQPVAVISNVTIRTAAVGLGSYVGFQQGASKIYFPLAMKGNSNNTTTFNVQNTGGTSADITLHFTPEPGGGYAAIADVTDTLAVGAAHTYNLGTMSQLAAITKWVGSVTAAVTDTANDSIAGVATTVNVKNADAYQLSTYNAFPSGSTSVVLPLIQENNNGNRTSINCQNMDPTVATTVTVVYTSEPGGAAKTSESKTGIVPNGLAVFIQNYTGGTKFVGSALATSSPAVPMVCVVNQSRPAFGRASSYEGFNPASATGTVVFPLIQSRNGTPANGYVYTTMNLSTSDGVSRTITCNFNPAPGFTAPTSVNKGGASVVFSQDDVYGTGAKFIGGATCTVGSGGLFGIVNHTRQNTPQALRDTLSTYNGFNR